MEDVDNTLAQRMVAKRGDPLSIHLLKNLNLTANWKHQSKVENKSVKLTPIMNSVKNVENEVMRFDYLMMFCSMFKYRASA